MSPLSLEHIRSRATAQSFARGESYYHKGAIFDTVRRGHDLEGRCEGSDYAPYHVRVTLDEKGGVKEASCTCPYDRGGDCKHIVALLLTYLHEPECFAERAPIEDTLLERSKEQLVTLIRQMIARYPDLQALIDRPVPGQQPGDQPADTEPFRRELRQAVRTFGEWDDHTAEQTIYSVADAARRFEETDDWRSACAIYQAILEECLFADQYPVDDEGEYVTALASVLERLAKCLEHGEIAQDDAMRRTILDRLLEAYIWDVDMGGYGLCDEVMPEALLAHTRQDDLPALRERILAAQRRKAESPYGEWGVEEYEDLLIQLDALDNTDPEVTLQRLREQGMDRLLFDKLLSLGRVEEAVAVITEHLTGPYERLQVLPALSAAGHDDMAVRLAQETVNSKFDHHLAQWLAGRYSARGDQQALLALRLQCMQQDPNEAYYAALKQAAEAAGTWESVRPEIIRQLEHSKEFEVLTRVYLDDQEWDAAWDTLARVPQGSRGRLSYNPLDFEVAERTRQARPQKAIPVYVDYARHEINQRSRGHYAVAARYLVVVRDLYRQLGDEETWRKLIGGIREEFRQLRALQDELNQVGL
ncbi:MAG: SWIM zinc finger family protein [Anaerolineae bacterium]|nr:SWIM zinc finger family protein [Anaerolineae bacterium]